ncbi:MAG: hypothetical protein HZB13_19785 [Acidobacteria bacterium]|nr:hypothetical protein [Acidobacteriota bacterium]
MTGPFKPTEVGGGTHKRLLEALEEACGQEDLVFLLSGLTGRGSSPQWREQMKGVLRRASFRSIMRLDEGEYDTQLGSDKEWRQLSAAVQLQAASAAEIPWEI